MIITSVSHLDHDLSVSHLAALLDHFKDRHKFFIETVDCQALNVSTVPCALYGPIMGDEPVPESMVKYEPRGDRPYPSRILDLDEYKRQAPGRGHFAETNTVDWSPSTSPGHWIRKTDLLTVIAGPHGEDACVMYTAFGGPLASKETGDPSLTEDERVGAAKFWHEHALVVL